MGYIKEQKLKVVFDKINLTWSRAFNYVLSVPVLHYLQEVLCIKI